MARKYMKRAFIQRVLALFIILLSVPAFAHHSFVSEYTRDEGQITGVIKRVLYKNPHARFYLDVVNQQGEMEEWEVQTQSVSTLVRFGITKGKFEVGTEVTAHGYYGRDGAKKIYLQELHTQNGEVIRPNPSQQKSREYQEVF
jgi:hypothetical protein